MTAWEPIANKNIRKRIVNIMKVYIERNNIQVELVRFRKNSDFIDVWNFELGIYFRDWRAHCYPWRVATGLFRGAPGAPDVSGHDNFGTRHFVTYSMRFIVASGIAQFGT